MRLAGSPSWQFGENVDQLPHAALFVRDAVGLPVPGSTVVPPRLLGTVPDHSGTIPSEARREAGAAWVGWWRAVLAHLVRIHRIVPPSGASMRDRTEELRRVAAEDRRRIVDPPTFASLEDRPGLRAAVREAFAEGCRWADERRLAWLRPRHGAIFGWSTVRDVAEEVASRRRVSPGDVRACAIVLLVDGTWWQRVAPGVVACSVGVGRDPVTARTVLADAFESGIGA